VYQLHTNQEMHNHDVTTDLIWHKKVPLKVFIFAWILLRNRLPSKDNLVVCSIISLEAQHCVSGCGSMIKTAQHLFLSCPYFGSLWGLVWAWLGISVADPFHFQEHFIRFAYSSGGSRVLRNFMQLVLLCWMCILWNERNNRIFKNKESTIHQLLEKVNLHSFRWMKLISMFV
jgi:hypothetical protein